MEIFLWELFSLKKTGHRTLNRLKSNEQKFPISRKENTRLPTGFPFLKLFFYLKKNNICFCFGVELSNIALKKQYDFCKLKFQEHLFQYRNTNQKDQGL